MWGSSCGQDAGQFVKEGHPHELGGGLHSSLNPTFLSTSVSGAREGLLSEVEVTCSHKWTDAVMSLVPHLDAEGIRQALRLLDDAMANLQHIKAFNTLIRDAEELNVHPVWAEVTRHELEQRQRMLLMELRQLSDGKQGLRPQELFTEAPTPAADAADMPWKVHVPGLSTDASSVDGRMQLRVSPHRDFAGPCSLPSPEQQPHSPVKVQQWSSHKQQHAQMQEPQDFSRTCAQSAESKGQAMPPTRTTSQLEDGEQQHLRSQLQQLMDQCESQNHQAASKGRRQQGLHITTPRTGVSKVTMRDGPAGQRKAGRHHHGHFSGKVVCDGGKQYEPWHVTFDTQGSSTTASTDEASSGSDSQ